MKKRPIDLIDIFVMLLVLGILYHEVYVVEQADDALIFLVAWLVGGLGIRRLRTPEGPSFKEAARSWLLSDTDDEAPRKKKGSE